jgi:8-oxo-dGTP pyrophosphatase MutT (NUDIX family)
MLRRGDAARFMPGVWVFAGGVVEDSDLTAAAVTAVPDDADPEEIAHRICGARELGEEAGIEVDPATLVPWSRWITPEEVPIRFDTRFYVALAPPHSTPRPDEVEMDEARWITPRAAIEAQRSGELEISFPTLRHLEMLTPHADAEAVLGAARERRVEPVLPKVVGDRDSFEVLLPDDPRYPG